MEEKDKRCGESYLLKIQSQVMIHFAHISYNLTLMQWYSGKKKTYMSSLNGNLPEVQHTCKTISF